MHSLSTLIGGDFLFRAWVSKMKSAQQMEGYRGRLFRDFSHAVIPSSESALRRHFGKNVRGEFLDNAPVNGLCSLDAAPLPCKFPR